MMVMVMKMLVICYLCHICDDDVDGDGDGDDRIDHHPDFLKTMMIRVTMTQQQKQQSRQR